MKSTAFALLTGLYAQAVSVSSAAVLANRDPSPEGVLLNLPQPHDQIRLIHQHPKTTNSLATTKRQSTTSSSVQGGAVLSSPQKKIKSVSATFRVPAAKVPTIGPTANNPVGVYASSFWVGIDGVTLPSSNSSSSCNAAGASLRLGVDIFYDGTFGGEQTPFAWFQYLPKTATGFGNFSVQAGDVVRLSATTTTTTNGSTGAAGGTVTIENFGPDTDETNSTSFPAIISKTNKKDKKPFQTATHTFTPDETSNQPVLCQAQAAFIVEDFPLAGMPDFPIALANFTRVEYADLRIENTAGEKVDLLAGGAGGSRSGRKSKAQAQAQTVELDIVQPPQGGRLTDCRVATGTSRSGTGSYSRYGTDSGVVVCDRIVEAV